MRPRGRLKVYIGSAAGVGKTYRMLTEAHDLRRRGVDVVVGFIETHGRADTEAQIRDLEVVPRLRVSHRGIWIEELDVDAVIARAPEVALVDELAHTNAAGSARAKRYEDVLHLLERGVHVITAVNVQHLESLGDVIARELGLAVRETVPDWVLALAEEIVNIDLSAEDLRQRLADGKVYTPERASAALANFFTPENLTVLRELALREVASGVDRQRAVGHSRDAPSVPARRADRIVVAMSSAPPLTRRLLERASRIAGRLNTDWHCVYVQTPAERADRIDSVVQRGLMENIQLAQRMGADVRQLEGTDVGATLLRFAREQGAIMIVVGQSRRTWWHRLRHGTVIDRLISERAGLDVLVVSLNDERPLGRARSAPVSS